MKKFLLVVAFVWSIVPSLWGQNLVKDSSFENLYRCPYDLGDFFLADWHGIGSNRSPDLFSNCAVKNGPANPNWYYCRVQPYADSSFVGILLGTKSTSYREYITTTLTHKLKEDSVYIFSIALAYPYFSKYRTPELDIILSEKPILSFDSYDIIERTPSFSVQMDSLKSDGTWRVFTIEYTAKGNEQYLSIGNFKSKKNTLLEKVPNRNEEVFKKMYDDAYICIDKVSLSLFKEDAGSEDPLIEINKESTQSFSFELGKPIVLHNIVFASDKSELLPGSFDQLDSLVQFLKAHPGVQIEINGHTDNSGMESRNVQLSEDRAASVAEYLISKGIDASRIVHQGFGSTKPLASNDSEDGRQLNRRVEFVLIE